MIQLSEKEQSLIWQAKRNKQIRDYYKKNGKFPNIATLETGITQRDINNYCLYFCLDKIMESDGTAAEEPEKTIENYYIHIKASDDETSVYKLEWNGELWESETVENVFTPAEVTIKTGEDSESDTVNFDKELNIVAAEEEGKFAGIYFELSFNGGAKFHTEAETAEFHYNGIDAYIGFRIDKRKNLTIIK